MNGAHIVDRHMNPEQYYADPKDGRYLDGSLKTVRTVNKEDMTAIQASASNRELYFEAAANYKRLFNQDHRVTGWRILPPGTDQCGLGKRCAGQHSQTLSGTFLPRYLFL